MTLAPFAVPEYTAADFSQETWWLSLIKAVFIIVFLIANVLLALWVERRGLGRMQTRPGPNVAGPLGLFQAFADAGKLLFKEDMWTRRAERFLYFLAPAIAAFAAFSVYAVIPMGPNVKIGDISTPLQLADMPVASCTSSRSRRWACTASSWVAGRLARPCRCTAPCVPPRRSSPTNWPWACPS